MTLRLQHWKYAIPLLLSIPMTHALTASESRTGLVGASNPGASTPAIPENPFFSAGDPMAVSTTFDTFTNFSACVGNLESARAYQCATYQRHVQALHQQISQLFRLIPDGPSPRSSRLSHFFTSYRREIRSLYAHSTRLMARNDLYLDPSRHYARTSSGGTNSAVYQSASIALTASEALVGLNVTLSRFAEQLGQQRPSTLRAAFPRLSDAAVTQLKQAAETAGEAAASLGSGQLRRAYFGLVSDRAIWQNTPQQIPTPLICSPITLDLDDLGRTQVTPTSPDPTSTVSQSEQQRIAACATSRELTQEMLNMRRLHPDWFGPSATPPTTTPTPVRQGRPTPAGAAQGR